MLIRKAIDSDLQDVLMLLEKVNLPKEGVIESFHDFFIIKKNQEILGCIGIEIYENVGLMRSVAIHPSFQKQGYGIKLVETMENYACEKGLKTIYVLTDTAEKFFKNLNYKNISREKADVRIKKSVEFTKLCPSSPLLEKKI